MTTQVPCPPSTLRSATLPRVDPTVARVGRLWADAHRAQSAGDHGGAERLFREIVALAPEDAEARLALAIALGWATPADEPRFDEVLVGVAIALEKAPRGTRRALRRRAARALTVLAEVRFDDTAERSAPREGAGADRLLEVGLGALRVLDVAAELDPAYEAAPRAVVRLATALLDGIAARSPLASALTALGVGKDAAVVDLLRDRRHRARRHLGTPPPKVD